MDATKPPKFLFFLLLSIFLILCSTGVFLYPFNDVGKQDQVLVINTIQHNSANVPTSTTPSSSGTVTPVVTVPSATPVTSVTPPSTPINSPPTPPTTNPPPPTPPSTNNPPAAGAGQKWCVANSGVSQQALQVALDYACGNGADCKAIQPSANCYSPSTLLNHASYAFNSYYQKNPVPTSCDFRGAANLTAQNPSTGTCNYPTSSSTTSPTTTPPTTTTTPTTSPTTMTPTPPTGYSSSSATPPGMMNGNIGGIGSLPPTDTTISMSTTLHHPFISFIIVVTSFIIGVIVLNI